jgi:flagellar assembly protein FliH
MAVIPKEQLADVQRWQIGDFSASGTASKTFPLHAAPAASQSETEPPPAASAEVNAEPAPALPTAAEIEAIYAQAQQEGYAAGLETGRSEGEQAARDEAAAARQEALAGIAALTVAWRDALAAFDQTIAEQTLEVALEIASQVIGSTVKVQPERILPIVREALQALPLHHGHISAHVHPDDLSALQEGIGQLGSIDPIKCIADPGLTPGSCLLRAGHSEIDATLDTRWKRVLENMGVDAEQWLLR